MTKAEPTPVEQAAAALAQAHEQREALRAKKAQNDLVLFDLGRQKQAAETAHGAALLADDGDTVASRDALASVRSALDDAEILKGNLVAAISEAGGAYNLALRAHADAVFAEQGAVIRDAADKLDAALLDVLEHRAMIAAAGFQMEAAAKSVSDSNPSRFAKARDLVSDTIRRVADGKLDVPFSLLIISEIPEAL